MIHKEDNQSKIQTCSNANGRAMHTRSGIINMFVKENLLVCLTIIDAPMLCQFEYELPELYHMSHTSRTRLGWFLEK